MKKAYAVILSVSVILLSACENAQQVSPAAASQESGTIIAEAGVDYDGNGEQEKLYVRMTAGEVKEETEPGPYTGRYWQGDFRLELVSKEGTLLHALDLNPTFGGESLIFMQNRRFDIAYEDYNGDGCPDFSLGQYFSSNGSTYNLYSLMPEGIAVIQRELFTADSSYSVRYEKTGSSSFKNRYYDMKKGEYAESIYTWQGDQFVRTECEGCEMKAGTPSPGNEAARLHLTVEKTGGGFRLAHDDKDGFHLAQTLVSPPIEGVQYGVHIVRTTTGDPQNNIRRDAVVVNPDSSEFQVYPLYSAAADDLYGVDSVAEAYGFLDDRHLVYVSAVNDAKRESGFIYRVEKLNIVTGEKSIVIPEIPGAAADDHFAPGWLNEAKDTLVLNSYRGGQLWTIDLRNGKIAGTQTGFSHSWPFFMTVKSPDGERFWYTDYTKKEYSLHDKSGRLLSTAAFGKGYDQYPAFLWSPDSRYAALQDTRDRKDAHIIGDDGEVYIIAPQRIRFFDREGKAVRTVQTGKGSGSYIEIAGWLDDAEGAALLHEYELDRNAEPAAKVNSRYRLIDLKSGEARKLQLVKAITALTDPVPARPSFSFSSGADRRVYWVDTKRSLITVAAEKGFWLPAAGDKRDAWVTNLYGPDTAVLHEFDPGTGNITEKTLGADAEEVLYLGTQWLVWGDMQYTRRE